MVYLSCNLARKLKNTCFITLFSFLSIIGVSEARWAINTATGWAASEIHPYRIGAMWSFRSINTPTTTQWLVFPIWETSLGYWDGEPHPERGGNDQVTVFTTGPLFRWQYNPKNIKNPSSYLEVGIAASWLSDTQIAGRTLSTHFQFEDKIGMGLRFGEQQQYDIGIRAIHYSNGSIKRPNNGVNMLLLSVGYWI
jgi:lipid A 3-O-deacylase